MKKVLLFLTVCFTLFSCKQDKLIHLEQYCTDVIITDVETSGKYRNAEGIFMYKGVYMGVTSYSSYRKTPKYNVGDTTSACFYISTFRREDNSTYYYTEDRIGSGHY
jgi:hypothetical protein